MRRTVILAILTLSSAFGARAQTPNTISTVAGGGANATTATSAYLSGPFGVARDSTNHFTYLSVSALSTVYKVDAAGNIAPYAGKGILGFSGDGGAATSAELDSPNGIAVDTGGNLFIADSQNNRIRRVDSSTHVITTVAGSGNQYNGVGFFGGFSGDGGPAISALMNFPVAVAVDGNGNLFIADSGNNVIRKVDNSPTHIITTFAGNGTPGTPGTANGDGGAATAAQLSFPEGVAVDSTGNVFIGDSGDSVVRKVDTSATPIITTYAGSAAHVFTFSGDGGPANQAGLNIPEGVSADSSGNLYIADTSNNRIRKVDNTPAHNISTFAGSANICLVTTGCGDGAAATSALLNSPTSVAVDGANGNIFLCDSGTQRYRMVVPGATPSINAYAGGGAGGDGSAATSALIGGPPFVTVDSSGDLLVVDGAGARIRKVNASTQVITNFAGNGVVGPPGLTNGDGGPATQANLSQVNHGIAIGPSGDVYFIDRTNFIVRRIDTTGTITRVAGSYGQRCAGASLPACGDGGAATSALLRAPTGIAVDSNENIYISDAGLNRIRVFAVGGNISNFAGTGTAGSANGAASSATFNGNWGIAFDANSNLFVADTNNNLIRKIDNTAQHNVTTYAFNGQPTFGGDGGTALSASMQTPQQVAVDSAGNVYVGGGFDNVVRRIDVNDQSVITVAGDLHNLDGGFRASDDGGPSTKALISNFGLEVFKNTATNSNTLYIADQGNNRIRKVNLAPVVQLTPATLQNFGPILVGDASAPQLLTIMNNGLDDLAITSALAPTGFIVSNLCINPVTQQSLASPGNSCFLEADFMPPPGTVGGTVFSGNITFSTNDPKNPTFSIPVTGTAIAPPGVALAVTLAGAGSGSVIGSPNGLVNGNSTVLSCPPTGAGGACTVNFAAGQVVNLVAIASAGSTLTQWNVNGSTTVCPSPQITCAVTMSAAQNVKATFGTATISVSGLGNGTGTITDNLTPPLISCTWNGTATSGTCSATYPSGTASVVLTAKATGTSSFSGWLGFCGLSGINSAGTGPCTLELNLTIVPTIAGTLATAVFSGPAKPFTSGQVFVGSVDGMIFVYNANGTLAQVLNSGNLGGIIAGMNFDTKGNLYAANIVGNTVERFVGGTATPTTFGSGYHSSPLGLVIDPSNNVFVGQSAGDNTLLEFDSTGKLTNTFFPAFDTGGIGYLELLDDGARVLYTSSSQNGTTTGSVRNYDIANNHQNPDFAINLPGGPAFAVRELSDKSVLVANSTEIVHLGPNGNLLGAPSPYKPGGGGLFFALNLDPTGTSFWAGDALTGKVYQVQISDGTILNTVNTGLGFNAKTFFDTIFGIAVFGQPPSGGADLAVTMTAPTTDPVNTQITYTATVTNNGPLTAAGVTATDMFPAGVTVNSAASTQGSCTTGQAPSCNIGTMNSGAKVTVTIKVTPTQATTLDDTITVNGTTPDPNTGNNSFTTATIVTGGAASATIAMSAPSSVQLGASLTYLIQVTNPGGSALTNLTVANALPGSLSATSFSPSCSGTTNVTCSIASLGAGQTIDLEITIVPTALGSLTNTGATVTGGGNSGPVSTNVINNGVPLLVELDSTNSADSVTSNPAGQTCTTAQIFCLQYFPNGTQVVLTANGPGFLGWVVDNVTSPPGCTGTGTCTVTMSVQHTVLAAYNSPVVFFQNTLPEGVVGVPYGVDLSQQILGGTKPFVFTVATGNLPNGLALSGSFISGTPTAAGTSNFSLKVTDSTNTSNTINTSITIINPPNVTAQTAMLNGPYGVLFRGVSDADASLRDFVGSLNFNGQGALAGTIDTNGNGTSAGPQTVTVTGTYSVGADNRGLAFLTTSTGKFGTFAFSIGDVHNGIAYTGHLIRFDDNTGSGTRGAGKFKRQMPSAFNGNSFQGPYVFAGTGQDPTFGYTVEIGLFTVNATGSFGSGSADVNENGTVGSITSIMGTYSTIDTTIGRTKWTLTSNGNPTSAISYIIDPNNVLFMTIDPGASNLVLAGTAERQDPGPFSNSSLVGPDVIAVQGPSGGFQSTNSKVLLGLVNTTPAGAPTNVTINFDSSDSDSVQINGTESAGYSISGNGRGVLNFTDNFIVYMVRQDHGFALDKDPKNPTFAEINFQHGGPFNDTSTNGSYFLGDREPASPSGGPVLSGSLVVSSGTATIDSDQSHERGALQYGGVDIRGFSTDLRGRVTLPQSGLSVTGIDDIGYLDSPSHGFFADIDPTSHHPHIIEAEAVAMPPGAVSPPTLTVNFPTAVSFPSSVASAPLTVTNTGDGIMTVTSVTNATDFSTSGSCVGTLPNVVVVAHGTCQLIINFAPAQNTAGGSVSENLTLQTDSGSVSITATGTVAGASGADLAITIGTAANVAVNTPLTYTIVFKNNGPQDATNVVMTDGVPGGLTPPASGYPAGCGRAFNVGFSQWFVNCNLATLANGASLTVTYSVTPTATGTLTNTATVSATQTDPNTNNNTASVNTIVGTTPLVTVNVGVANNNTSGGTVVDNSTPPLINCFTNGAGVQSGTCQASYAVGAVVTFKESPNAGAAFSSWNGPCQTGTGGTTTTCTITVTNPIGVTTAFYTNGPGTFTLKTALPASLTASTGNGTVGVGVTGGGISCSFTGSATPTGTCSNAAEKSGQIVELIPLAGVNSTFAGWAGTCAFQMGNDCFVTMSQNQTATPVFTIVPITLNVTVTGVGSVVDNSTPPKINCVNTNATTPLVCSATYNSGTSITLTETAGTGYTFGSFTGCNPASPTTCTINFSAANNPVNAGATFTINSYLLDVSTTGGTGTGTVTSNANNLGGKIGCGPNNQPPGGCGLEELFGWTVMLSEVPTGTDTFTGWTSSAVPGFTFPCTTNNTTCTFNMPALPAGTPNLTITATFGAPALISTLQVSIQGSGKVASTSNPTIANEINCAVPAPPSVCTAMFASGTQISLFATPGNGEAFSGWTAGPCNGAQTNPCVFGVSAGAPVNVTATFVASAGPTFTSTTLPAGAVTVSYGADIQVTGGTQPYTFAVANGSSLPTGFTLDPIASGNVQAGHVWADNPATSGNLSFMVTVTDSSSPTPQSVTGTITIPISPTPPNTQASLLNGRYAMLSHGFRDVDGSPEADTGSLLFDGLGGLTGVVDMNNSAGVQQEVQVTGTYTIGPDNRGTLVLTVAQGSFHGTISVGDVYRGIASTVRITQFNNNNGTDRIGSGILRLQDTTAFSPTPLSGTYVFSASGVTPSLGRAAYAGLLTFDAANNLTGGTVDANDAGTLSNVPSLTGTYTGPDLNGHVVFSGLINAVPFKYGLYQISANEFFILSLTLQSGGNDVVAGSGLRQSSLVTFGAASLAGPDVVSLGGVSNQGTFAAAGIFTANPAATPTPTFSITADTNDGGILKLGTVVSGTYSVGLNGRAILTPTSGSSSNPAFVYLAQPDRGFFLIGDASAGLGPLVPQVGAPFPTTPITSNLFFGQQEAITSSHSEFSGIGVLGAGDSLTITDDESHLGGDLFFDRTLGTFTPTITGAGHITLQTAAQGTISGYLISPFEFAFIDQNGPASDPAPSARPHIAVAHTIPAAPGTPSPAAPTVTFPTPVAVGSNQSMSLTITNTGLGPLGFTGVNTANSPDFSASGTCIGDGVVVVQVQGTCMLTITFGPKTGTPTGTLLTETLVVQTDGTTNVTVTEKGTAAAAVDFTLSATPASQSVNVGASTTYTVNVAALGGFSASVALSVTGQPTGTTATFNPTAITPGAPSTLTVTTASNTPLGTSTLTITGTGGGLTHSTQVQLIVTPTLVSIAVAPTTASIAVGKTQQFTATGTFSDKSTQNLTATVSWASSNTAAATIVSGGTVAGTATGVKAGTTTITASLSGVTSNGATLTVTAPTLVSIAVTPASPTVVVGQTQQFTATGTFSDKSTQDLTASVVWASSNTEAATITGGGLATGVTGGETSTISATMTQSEVSGSTLLTVTTVPFVLAVTPPAGGSGSPATVTPGGSVAIGLTLTATPGFTGTVTFSCVSNQPQFLTCTPAPGSVTLSGNKAKNVAIVLNTFCSGSPTYGPGPGGFGGGLALLLATAMLGSVTWAYRRRSRWALSFAVLVLMALGSSACNSLSKGTAGATPPGNYILNITATAGTASQTIQVPIQVLP